ncbi:hypothetical protein SNE40_008906 [Patella caerulea]|uniref:Cyclin-dependent kinase 2-interacting protein n=1 Tax=Patella caerulea TaxID=87958 RepID=A0AAN8Q2A9_PATCE
MATPSKDTDNKDVKGLVFSPIKSPVAELPKGNLTGKPRKLKDGAADVHNLILTWKGLNIDGTNLFNQIANIKLEKVFQVDGETEEEKCNLPSNLEPLCEQLLKLHKDMKKVVVKLVRISEMIKGIIELSDYQHGETGTEVFFKTWNLHDFSQTVSEICEMFEKELKLKKCLIENIAHSDTRKLLMFYSAAWIHQPYISTQLDFLVDSLLLETGLK